MKGKNIKQFLLIFFITGILFNSTGQAVNLINNGGFENSGIGWKLEINEAANATQSFDTVGAKEGTKFLRINVKTITTDNWHIQLKDPDWTAKTDYLYHFSMWAKADSIRKVGINVYGDTTSKYKYRTSSTIYLTTEWKQYHQMFIADADGAGQINFAIICGNETGIYDIDGVVITETLAPPGILYLNSGFEAEGAGWALNIHSTTAVATMSFPETGAKSGKKFARINVTSIPEDPWRVQLSDGSWTAKADNIYNLQFWAKADSGQVIDVAVQGGKASNFQYYEGMKYYLTGEWKQYTYNYFSSVGGKDSLNFNFYLGGAVGVYDFDDIQLYESDPDVFVIPGRRAFHKRQVYKVHIHPKKLRCVSNTPFNNPIVYTIHNIAGQRLSAQSIISKGQSFDIPRPTRGIWIISIGNNTHQVISVP